MAGGDTREEDNGGWQREPALHDKNGYLMRGLYAIVDVATLTRAGLSPLPFAEAVLSARPAALQLRDKSSRRGGADMLALLRELVPMCRRHGVPLFANDRADLAQIAGCDGVHVGQRDLPGSLARTLLARGRLGLVGISAHNDADVELALAERPDYIGLGPVFGTVSKENPEPTIGLDGLARLAARVHEAGLPSVAIGGIDIARAASTAALCPCSAVIGALVTNEGYEHVAKLARELQAALLGPLA